MSEAAFAVADTFGAATRLSVTRMRLTNFRCYSAVAFDGDERPVVLTGPNGAGKTNMLEAVSYLTPGRGLRQAKLTDVDRRGSATGWAVAATVSSPGGAIEIGTGRDPAATRRAVRINGAPANGQGALAEYVSVVWLTPQMDRLFLDGATARRRFLDRLIFGFDAEHSVRVSAYEHAMRERSRLLKYGRRDDVWLAALEETMAGRGVAIAAARREFAGRLARACAESTGPFPRAGIAAEGQVEDLLARGPALAAEDHIRQKLAESRDEDKETGRTAIGPHRSDFAVRHLEKDMPADQCSTGEQKTLLLAVVLADARLQAAERNVTPLLLLDEVAAHLDTRMRRALFEEVQVLGVQAWLTGTDRLLFDDLDTHAQFFTVADATLQRAA